MKNQFAATCFVIGAFLAPVAGHAADGDKDRSSPKDFVKDSIITTKIKTKLAEEKFASTVKISVDTDAKGMVVMSGTAKTQNEIDKAGSIARATEGVVSVQNNIKIAAVETRTGDGDKDRSSPKDFVKDSVITSKIKTKLAGEKFASTVKISVDTDAKGMVVLSGTAKTQAEIDKAGSLARTTEGVVSVKNDIKIAKP